MRTLLLSMTIIAGACVLQSCKDDEKKSSNELTYDGNKIKIVAAIREEDVDEEEGPGETVLYEHEVYLLAEGLSATTSALSGKGDVAAFSFMSTSATEVAPGTYTINYGDAIAFGASMLFYRGYDASQDVAESTAIGGPGTIVIAKDGDTYTFTLDLTVSEKKLTGTYKGTLALFSPN